ncbi:protein lethal(3)malignant blood neoplasm 1 isoform X2 [Halyomorpha halys]|uniref:protein lethal(3)malignant blood neoplasm 1 isoform X2 n=1 Tax=Halyomorpha halys TaxID=286706 RepID=UPI0006D4CB16|nr:protein lethal(3)malignant blood neoplasm 1 isoform X2 [Halyomorpha halys]
MNSASPLTGNSIDEKGIIMGEFGFITADGIYHVTVYATDENGDFKIISMKNIKVGFPPGKVTTTTAKPLTSNLQLNGIRGCSGCLIPETMPIMVPKEYPPGDKSFVKTDVSSKQNLNINRDSQSSPLVGNTPMNRFEASGYSKIVPPNNQQHGYEQQNKQGPQNTATPVPSTSIPNNIPHQDYDKPLSGNIHTQINVPGSHPTTKPVTNGLTTNLNLNQIKTTPINTNLQPKLSEMEIKILDYMAKLYKFNYTLSFHGHEEVGDLGGNKNGSYFSNGRDGYQRKVVYIANEFGYQPKISLVKLDDELIPKEETEKELTKLKGSEFIWLY